MSVDSEMRERKNSMNQQTIDRLRAFLLKTRGKMMHVRFTKRSTGELRDMPRCRTGVKKYKKDPSSPPDPDLIEQDQRCALLRVFDMDAVDKKTGRKGAYRMITLDGLQSIKVKGEEFTP